VSGDGPIFFFASARARRRWKHSRRLSNRTVAPQACGRLNFLRRGFRPRREGTGEIYVKGFSDLRPEAFFASEHNHLSPFGGKPTVLVVEDSEDTRRVLSLELRHRGCRVVTAADGFGAVEAALAARPDLILMDLNLPGLDGLAATERIREHVELNAVPVIAVTAFDTYGIREAALEAGCQQYLLKPLDAGALARALREALPGFDFAPDDSGAPPGGRE